MGQRRVTANWSGDEGGNNEAGIHNSQRPVCRSGNRHQGNRPHAIRVCPLLQELRARVWCEWIGYSPATMSTMPKREAWPRVLSALDCVSARSPNNPAPKHVSAEQI